MMESKVITICPKCKVLMQIDTETCDIEPLNMGDPELDIVNQAKFEYCVCNQDYAYLDELQL